MRGRILTLFGVSLFAALSFGAETRNGCNANYPPDGGAGGSPGIGGSSGIGGSVVDECTSPVDDCQEAECTLGRLKCPEARSPKGTPFSESCRRAREDSRDWRPDCIARITACSQVEAAYRTKAGAKCPQ